MTHNLQSGQFLSYAFSFKWFRPERGKTADQPVRSEEAHVSGPDEQPPRASRDAACRFAVDLARNGYPAEEIKRKLVESATDPESAREIVRNLGRRMSLGSDCPPANAPDDGRSEFYGGLWCVGGIVVTVGSFLAAATAGGGTYVVAWGAIVFGGIQFLRGMMRTAKN
ncbi:MAG: hypothetical protein JWO38_6186 [Gemmataceae bacterium]|nr:hypothetical protein [Gemmataceae bacterium]